MTVYRDIPRYDLSGRDFETVLIPWLADDPVSETVPPESDTEPEAAKPRGGFPWWLLIAAVTVMGADNA